MLLQFTVGNYLSFDDEVTLSLLATDDVLHPEHLIVDDAARGGPVLRAAAVYGANASGKSNLVRAVRFARDCILTGTRPGLPVPVEPFRLRTPNGAERPSKFQFILRLDGALYDYGFVATRRQIEEEWLFTTAARKGARDQRLFERHTSEQRRVEVRFGQALAGREGRRRRRLEFVAEGTRPNQLLLTEAFERQVQELDPLRRWFDETLLVISAETRFREVPLYAHRNAEFLDFLREALRGAGTGIADIATHEEPLDLERHFPHAGAEQREFLRQRIAELPDGKSLVAELVPGDLQVISRHAGSPPTVTLLHLLHAGPEGGLEPFALRDESDGTRRLIHLLPALFRHQSAPESVLFLDELDCRLHPLLSRLLIRSALEGLPSCRNQLIFTTHETGLLDLKLLRRDEIWFVEKDRGGASHLYSLAEFRVRPDLAIEKGYLNGRFGAIPFAARSEQRNGAVPAPEPAGLSAA